MQLNIEHVAAAPRLAAARLQTQSGGGEDAASGGAAVSRFLPRCTSVRPSRRAARCAASCCASGVSGRGALQACPCAASCCLGGSRSPSIIIRGPVRAGWPRRAGNPSPTLGSMCAAVCSKCCRPRGRPPLSCHQAVPTTRSHPSSSPEQNQGCYQHKKSPWAPRRRRARPRALQVSKTLPASACFSRPLRGG